MGEFNFGNLVGGLLAYGMALLVAYLAYTLNILSTPQDEVALLKKGHRSTAITLGATILSQCFLSRHAVFASMAIIRLIFVERITAIEKFYVACRSFIFLALIISLALLSVRIAGWFFKIMTRRLDEDQEIERDNVSVAIFYGLVLLAMTLIIDEGMQDLSQSLISLGRNGAVVRIP
jgi:uncharacterized membrane protein YjfL (UPF0719 family)